MICEWFMTEPLIGNLVTLAYKFYSVWFRSGQNGRQWTLISFLLGKQLEYIFYFFSELGWLLWCVHDPKKKKKGLGNTGIVYGNFSMFLFLNFRVFWHILHSRVIVSQKVLIITWVTLSYTQNLLLIEYK